VARVAAGTTLELELEWHPEDAEEYAWIDPVTSQLTTRREALLVSWFAIAGSFTRDRSEVTEGDTRVVAGNSWMAPAQPGSVVLWTVLRDSRGGAAFIERPIDVE
jgi:hypothetical protein